MINLQWGTQKNGQIDTHLLVDVSGRGDYLEPTAAAQWKRMVAACKAATGVTLAPAPGSSAYRPLSIQQDFYAKRQAYLAGKGPYFPVAAVPGTSNHGWGRAIDLTGYEGNAQVWAWLQSHAGEFGYDWATGRASGEDWHWECLTPPGTPISTTDVASGDAALINQITAALEADEMLLITAPQRLPLLIGPFGSINLPDPAANAVNKERVDVTTGILGAKAVNARQYDVIHQVVNDYAANAKKYLLAK